MHYRTHTGISALIDPKNHNEVLQVPVPSNAEFVCVLLQRKEI